MELERHFQIRSEKDREETVRHIISRATVDLANKEFLSKLRNKELIAIKVCLDGLAAMLA